ncbi:DUF1775 domain-containing protein [Mangrovicoccus algicola]|uniref:DUF1775 domain-containing protein n=1 Tax=Mangrovicoccus algicola TaxID=2771008 RepID=A0A8J6YTL9_9RHOB|nr:DUF1775 domain-containing protein [Mangrovicoccus algicola]MBE3637592.1 DUF1775 domain-containing protein [Mangrovicoccus algicola]
MSKRTLSVAIAALLSIPALAQAHATLEQKQAVIGATTKITLRVPHGCDGAATDTVRLEIPEGVYNVKPMPKPGWDLRTETGAYATPFVSHGQEMTEGVRAVIWSGGDLPDAFYDEFTIRGTVGPDAQPGAIHFPAVQGCGDATADWTDTSGSHDVPNPAPALMLVAGEDGGHGLPAGAAELGDLAIEGGFARATLPNQPVAGGFLSIANHGSAPDRLVAAAAPVAGRTELHEMSMKDDVMVMRELQNGLEIPAGGTATLAPGGNHIMFMELTGPLAEGDTVSLTLTFEQAGEVTFDLPVLARDADGAAEAHDHSHMHAH